MDKMLVFVQALKDAGITSIDEVMDLFTSLLISHFYELVEKANLEDKDLKVALGRMDEANLMVGEALQETGNAAEAFLTLLIMQRNILDALEPKAENAEESAE